MMSRKKYSMGQAEMGLTNGVVASTAPTSKEQTALLKFKERLKDLIRPEHDDHYLSKWLKARNYDVDKAVQMFRASMAYRARMDVEGLVRDYTPPEVLEKYLPGGFRGYDKDGSPVLIELYGNTDMKGILYSVKRSDIEKTKLLMGEKVMRMLESQTKKLGHTVDGMTVIIDMENVGASILWGPGIQMYAHMGRILQDNYPEIVKRSFIVNAPRIFPMLWKMFRPLVTEEMKQKVCILGGDYKDELLRYIDARELPAFLGGELRDADGNGRCVEKICQGGLVPESYYRTDLSNSDNYQTKLVGRGEKKEIKINVDQFGSILRWEFKTDGYDIGFGVQLENANGRIDIIPVERVNSHMVPEDGTHLCNKTGTYILIFDNTYSWTRGKSINYNLDVVAPDDSLTNDLDELTKGGSWQKLAEDSVQITHL